jgi:hypothetical protein
MLVNHLSRFTNLEDAFNFELNRLGKNGAEFEGGWTPVKCRRPRQVDKTIVW